MIELSPAVALCGWSIQAGMETYRDKWSVGPTTLCVHPSRLEEAYHCLEELEYQHLRYLWIVGIPGLPKETWFVCGGEGIVISEFD